MCWGENTNITFTLVSNAIAEMLQEEFEDTKGIIRIYISKKERQHIGQTKIYKTLHIKLKIE